MRYNLRRQKILEDNCLICDASENIVLEEHHVRHIRKTKVKSFTALMSKLNRKQVAVCKSCHHKTHQGLYEGLIL